MYLFNPLIFESNNQPTHIKKLRFVQTFLLLVIVTYSWSQDIADNNLTNLPWSSLPAVLTPLLSQVCILESLTLSTPLMKLNSLEMGMHFSKNNRKIKWLKQNLAGSAAKWRHGWHLCRVVGLHYHKMAYTASALLLDISSYQTPAPKTQLKFPQLWKGGNSVSQPYSIRPFKNIEIANSMKTFHEYSDNFRFLGLIAYDGNISGIPTNILPCLLCKLLTFKTQDEYLLFYEVFFDSPTSQRLSFLWTFYYRT